MLGLPGSGFTLTKDGRVDASGALSLSTPVAYGLGNNRFVLGGASLSNSLRPRFPETGKNDDLNRGGNGTAQFLYGISLKQAGTLTPAIVFLSGHGDTVFNLQYTAPPVGNGDVTYAIGVLDIAGSGGASGQGQPSDGDSTTSFYGVATYTAPKYDAHISLGIGSRRYEGLFGNASMTVIPNVKGYLEYDTFNVNGGVGWSIPMPSKSSGNQLGLVLQVGVVRGKYLSTSINFSF